MKFIEVQSAGITDTGKQRSENQDQFLVAEITRSMAVRFGSMPVEKGSRLFGGPMGYLFLVADGMGGHRGGSEASQFAIQYFANAILNSTSWSAKIETSDEDSFVEDLKRMLANAHQAIIDRSEANFGFEGMGTTLTMAYVVWPRVFVVHAGDTRCYLLRNKELQLMTRDHTVANEMMQKGQLSPDELERSHWSNVLVNALGAGASSVFAEVYKHDLQQGDSLLLCSDGLNKHVSDDQIRKSLLAAIDPMRTCQELVDLAKQGGGSDNITVVTVRFLDADKPASRMRIIAAVPSKESVLQDLEIPETELDTSVDEPGHGEISDKSTSNGLRETIDFFESGDGAKDGFRDASE